MQQKMFKKIKAVAAFLLAVSCIFSVWSAQALTTDANTYWGGQAQKQDIIDNSGLPADTNVNDLRSLIAQIIRIVLGFLGILSVIIVLYAGFKWMTSGGNEETVGEAKKMLIAGLIGLVIILLSYAIANFVINQIVNITDGR